MLTIATLLVLAPCVRVYGAATDPATRRDVRAAIREKAKSVCLVDDRARARYVLEVGRDGPRSRATAREVPDRLEAWARARAAEPK